MGRFIAAVAALFVLLAAIVVLAPNLVPAKTYKPQLEAEASKALGRKVTMGDKLSFKIIPQPAFTVSNLTIANADGFEGDHLARVEKAAIGVKLGPLFKKRVEISRFILTKPELNLRKAKSGAINWNLARADAKPAEGGDIPLNDLSLGDVRFIDGKATYADGASGKTYALDKINATARLTSLSEPLEIAGEMNFQGAPSTVDVVLSNLADVLAKKPSNLKLDLAIGAAAIGADLALEGGETFAYKGPVSLSAPDLPGLARLFDVKLENAPGFDKLSVSGEARGAATSLALAGAKIGFDAINADGDIKLDWSGAKPKATGDLATGALDLRPYLPPPPADAQGFPAWSTAKIDFSSLRNIDADLNISAKEVYLNDIKTGAARMRMRISGGRMIADIPDLTFYNGAGSGRLIVDAARAAPSIAGDFKMASVDANPFTVDLMKMDKLLGVGGFTFKFNATGSSQKSIMESMDGEGGFDLNDGALKGVNIAKLATAVAKLYEGGLTNPTAVTAAIAEAQRADEKTDFSKFLSAFTIVDGQMQAPSITLEGPYLTMTGVGQIDLPGQKLDIRLLPRASTSIDGTTGRLVSIPVKVGGSFSKPTIGVDLESLIRGKAEQSLKGILDKALKPKTATEPGATETDPSKSLLEDLLGVRKKSAPADTGAPAPEGTTTPASTPAEESPTESEESVVGGAIKGLFGRAAKPTASETPAKETEPETAEPNE